MPRPAVTLSRPGSGPSRAGRLALGVLALVVVSGLPACATGFGAQTTTIYTAPAGADVRTGDVKALNVLVVADDEGAGTLVAALVNTQDEDDALEGVTVADIDSLLEITVTGLDSPVPLPAGELVQLAAEDADFDPIGLTGDSVEPGQVLRIDMHFSNAGAVTAEVPVVSREEEYASVPTPAPPKGGQTD